MPRKRNTDVPNAQAQKAEPRAKSQPRTRPGGTPLLMPLPWRPWSCWALAAAHTRTREAFQRPGTALLGVLEVTGVPTEPTW